MKIAIVTDKSRMDLLPSEEGFKEDEQKRKTIEEVKEILSQKYDCISLIADDNIISQLKTENVDLVFNLCNGIRGDSKLAQLPAILEYANIPYTGSSVLGHTLAINKIYSSKIFKAANIPTPDFVSIYSIEQLKDINIKFPILVKPNDEGSSRGIHQDSLVFDMDSLTKKVDEELKIYNPPIMLNKYIEGREFSIGIIGNDEDMIALPIQEVDLSNLPKDLSRFYSFEIKAYYKDRTVYHIPPSLGEDEIKLMENTAIKAFKTLGLKDYARVDIRYKNGVPYVLEINSLPGLMKGKSSLYRMAEATSLGYEGLIFKIVETAIKRYNLEEGTFDETSIVNI
ncbi:D-alanine--D-alanine ligase family protein [Clostridium sp. Cult2]|uniref:D-alanine--D-alanine ligase family protein n=1 Tax=Clostridium sp. Cult2 TaxID=2079003 RepID=UPI001F024BC3|nr:ATP-grasp domain-containing protein [Clostridium sp. Cult2]MCF6466774.1 D-alanine--D-alanine ligase [Clostridium sp. Cult2]